MNHSRHHSPTARTPQGVRPAASQASAARGEPPKPYDAVDLALAELPRESMDQKLRRLLPVALALDPATVEPFRWDPIAVYRNASSGMERLAPHREHLATAMPGIDWDAAFEAGDVAEALVAACRRPTVSPVSGARKEAVRAELQSLRGPALRIARALAELGHLPLEAVERIEAGSGWIDTGLDGIALADLFESHQEGVAGMHPFTGEALARMRTLGEWIVRNVSPAGVRAADGAGERAARAERDRLWTLLTLRYRDLRRGGFLVFGDGLNDALPPLRSFTKRRKAGEPENPPEAPRTEAPGAPNPPPGAAIPAGLPAPTPQVPGGSAPR